jgi:hypothetical protein
MSGNWPQVKKYCDQRPCSGKVELLWPDQITSSQTVIDPIQNTQVWFQNSLYINPFPVYGNVVTDTGTSANIQLTSGSDNANTILPCCQCQMPLSVRPNVLLNGDLAINTSDAILTRRGGNTTSSFIVKDQTGNQTSYSINLAYHYSCIDNLVTANIYQINLATT